VTNATLPDLITEPVHADLVPPIRLERTRDGESCGQGGSGKWFTVATFGSPPTDDAIIAAFGGGHFRLVDANGKKVLRPLLAPVKPVGALRDSFARYRDREASESAAVEVVAELRTELATVRAELATFRDRAAELERRDAERERDFEEMRTEYAASIAEMETARENPPADPMTALLSQIEAFAATQARMTKLAAVFSPQAPAAPPRPSALELALPGLLNHFGPVVAQRLGGGPPAAAPAAAGKLKHDWSELEAAGLSPEDVLALANSLPGAAEAA